MHIVTRKRLNEFAEKHPNSKESLQHWYKIMKRERFQSFAELCAYFPHADRVGKLTVFNIGGNKVRLNCRNTLQSTESVYSCGANS